MSLADLIRKRSTRSFATAIPAIPATDSAEPGSTVARIATVAVANPPEPLSTQDEATIRAWLEHIGETDPEELARVWERCRTRLDARAYVLAQAALATSHGLTCACRGDMPATASSLEEWLRGGAVMGPSPWGGSRVIRTAANSHYQDFLGVELMRCF